MKNPQVGRKGSRKLTNKGLPELNEAYQKIMLWFFSFPTKEFGLSELAENLKIAKTTATHAVSRLVDEEFLQLKIYGRVWRISCNQNHIYTYSRKLAYNLMMVYESGIIEDIQSRITKNPRCVILFGSYRKGDDTDQSDIDIAVEMLDDEPTRILELGIFDSFGYRSNVKINAHLFSRKTVDSNLFANIANGIVLQGFLEVKP